MNLADYLSELLGQYEEVSVPGLGCFVRERINGYYNDSEAKFYPPQHRVKFSPQLKEDDTFAQYVADKKNISLASSKYFAEKFISKLKEQALIGKYLFADLGLFYTDQGQLVFKPNDTIADDPSFYGYPPINIYKLSQPLGGEAKPVYKEPVSYPVISAPPVQTIDEQHYFEEEPDRKRGMNIWLIILIGITVAALAIFGIYKFYPAAFAKLSAPFHKADTTVTVHKKVIIKDTIKKAASVDTVSKPDTTVAKVAAPMVPAIDTVNQVHFDVTLREPFKKLTEANAEVKHYKTKGINARVIPLTEAPGPRYKISFGTYLTLKDANDAMLDLVNTGKINKDLRTLQLNPRK